MSNYFENSALQFSFAPNSEKMSNNQNSEEFVPNKRRDWIVFFISSVAMVALLIWKPEWVWVAWPFQFTALTGALSRM